MSRVAAVQMTSAADVAVNLEAASGLLDEAAREGAVLAMLPETFPVMGRRETDKLGVAEPEGDGPVQAFLSRRARETGMWLVGGTIPLAGAERDRVHPASLVFDADGRQVARYDKIHLFDVTVPGNGESYRESDTWIPGDGTLVTVDTPAGRLGLAVCYDLRFPELFRELAGRGADLIALPSAFTAATGYWHWEPLIRARAIENQCYMIAPAQGGTHESGRVTHGDSMVVDPWGRVLDRRPAEPGVVVAEVDLDYAAEIRRRFPALEHGRL